MIAVHIGSFLHGSSVHGSALIRQERRAIAAAAANRAICRGFATGGSPAASRGPGARSSVANADPSGAGRHAAVRGLLEAPALGLVAPVEQGTSDAVLSDAVGHIPASAWPGRPGTSVFSAHDVTWFSGLDRLKRGDEIRYLSPCRTLIYRVTAHRVVHAGYPVYNTATPSLVLGTCYPLDALYPTSRRYLVYATLAATQPAIRLPWHRAGPPPLTVPVPRALAEQGLGLDRNQAPLGTLRFAGSPSPAWRQANAPLQAEATALAAYFGMVRSAEQRHRTWWADLARPVPVSAVAGLWGGGIAGYDSRINVRLLVRGDQMLGATLTTVLTTAGSEQPGTYQLRVTETVTGSRKLLVSGVSMRPAGFSFSSGGLRRG